MNCHNCSEPIEFMAGRWTHVLHHFRGTDDEGPECGPSGNVATPDPSCEEYDDAHESRTCKACGFVAYGGPTSTHYELYDHQERGCR